MHYAEKKSICTVRLTGLRKVNAQFSQLDNDNHVDIEEENGRVVLVKDTQ